MTLYEIVMAIIKFLTEPAWHLVVLYVILLLLVVKSMLKGWGFIQ